MLVIANTRRCELYGTA